MITPTKEKISPLGDGNNSPDMDYKCRICHEGSSTENLVSPCYCMGTVGQMHATCLEKWLTSTGRRDCELCGYHYHLYLEPQSFKEFLKHPGDSSKVRYLKFNLFFFALLTITALTSVCLLLYAASLIECKFCLRVVCLISAASFVATFYIALTVWAYTYQRKLWQKWRFTHQIVRLKSPSMNYWDYQDSRLPSTLSKANLTEAHKYLPTSVAVTSREAESDLYALSPELLYPGDLKSAMSTCISFDENRFSQSYSDIRAALPSSSSSTFMSETSPVAEVNFHNAISTKTLSEKG